MEQAASSHGAPAPPPVLQNAHSQSAPNVDNNRSFNKPYKHKRPAPSDSSHAPPPKTRKTDYLKKAKRDAAVINNEPVVVLNNSDLEFPERIYKPKTKVLHWDNAVQVLQDYVASLRNNLAIHGVNYTVEEIKEGKRSKFIATVKLPFNAPIRSVTSDGETYSKAKAKASAAYNAVRELMHYGEVGLDLSLTPKHASNEQRTSRRGRKAGEGVDKTSPYTADPQWWKESPHMDLDNLFGCVIQVSFEDFPVAAAECRPLLFVTSRPLPFDGAEFDVSGNSVYAVAKLSPSYPLKLRQKDLDRAFKYSTALYEAASGRPLLGMPADFRYLVLPLKWTAHFTEEAPLAREHITWGEVADTATSPLVPLPYDDEDLVARLEGRVLAGTTIGPRWTLLDVRDDISASTIRKETESPYGHLAKGERKEFGYAQHAEVTDSNQPLIEVSPDVENRSLGYVSNLETATATIKLALPELLLIHSISAGTLRTASFLPLILPALDSQLLALEMSTSIFGGRIKSDLARQAITASSSRPVATTRDDYQRLELLGDQVLKFLSCVFVYATHVHDDQGNMTIALHKIETNAKLTECARNAGIAPYIRGIFRSPSWIPHGWRIRDGFLAPKVPATQILGNKTLADVAEALLAASLLSAGESNKHAPSTTASLQAVLDTIRTLRIPVPKGKWADLRGLPLPDDARAEVSDKPFSVFGYKFRDPAKGRIAISMTRGRRVFERYEFVGDAFLNYMTLLHLWEEYPDATNAALTVAKHSRNSNGAFMALTVSCGLIDLITDDPSAIHTKKLATSLRQHQAEADAHIAKADAELQSGVEYWSGLALNKHISDVLEAVFGAIFDDSDFDPAPAKLAYETHVYPFLRRYCTAPRTQSTHPRSEFLRMLDKRACLGSVKDVERVPGEGKGPRVAVISVKLHGEELGRAEGENQQLAERQAFAAALESLKSGQQGGECDCARQ